jgi:hypothetical protein
MTDRPGISLAEWYPLIRHLAPTPLTTIIPSPDLVILGYGKDPHAGAVEKAEFAAAEKAMRALAKQIKAAAAAYGYPFFLRTGHTSGKHDWDLTCHVPSAGTIPAHIRALCQSSAEADIMGLPCDVWVVREMLETVPAFFAFRGLPITRERRFFVHDGQVTGWQPYWPPDAIREPTHPDWRGKLDYINAPIKSSEAAELTGLTERVGAVLPGYWSVDWLWTVGRGWVLTDMAWAERSFVWKECPTAPKDLKGED